MRLVEINNFGDMINMDKVERVYLVPVDKQGKENSKGSYFWVFVFSSGRTDHSKTFNDIEDAKIWISNL